MRIRKLSTVVATAATLALLATACSGGSGSDEPTGADGVSDKILTIGMPNGPQQPNQNPLANGSASLFMGAKITHLGLLPQGQPERDDRVVNMVAQHDHEGFGGCTNIGACTAACPKEIPLDVISQLNKDLRTAIKHGH